MSADRDRRIRTLNDFFRSTFLGGKILFTRRVAALPLDVQARVVLMVQHYAGFGPDNDPYGEHDFGSFEIANETVFFKIDYYNVDGSAGSDDPADPDRTRRVLTIMLSDEY